MPSFNPFIVNENYKQHVHKYIKYVLNETNPNEVIKHSFF